MLKRIAAGLGFALLLALLAWAAGVLYTQRKVAQAIRHLREEHLHATEPGFVRTGGLSTAVEEVAGLGCRALPALLAELDPDLNPYYLCRVADCLTDVSDGTAPRVFFGEDREGRRRAIDTLRAWWEKDGRRRHAWWRFWTSRCVQ